MPVALALTPDARWTTDAGGLVRDARAAGFTAVGMTPGHARAGGAEALAAAGMRCHELLSLIVSGNEARTLDSAVALAAAAGAVRAEWVLTILAVPPSAGSLALLARCADVVASAGARLAVEFSPLGPLGTLAEAVAVARAVGGHRVGVLIDTWHFFRGESTWEDLEQVPLELIAYLQFDDAPAAVSGDGFEETLNRRLFPGEGTFELERFADTLLRRGWDGTVSVEVLNAELARQPVAAFARTAFESTARFWR